MDWFRKLLPREDRFFDLFERHASLVLTAAESLQRAVAGDGSPTDLQAVSEREMEADVLTRDVLLSVRRTFITPFDRSAITGLISALDDAIDQMQKTCKSIALFKVTRFEPEMVEMADCIVRASAVVVRALPLLRNVGANAAQIGDLAESLSRIEGQTDDLYDAARSRLFATKGPTQPIDFWVASEILGHLEKVVDRLEDVANEISGIAIEHV